MENRHSVGEIPDLGLSAYNTNFIGTCPTLHIDTVYSIE